MSKSRYTMSSFLRKWIIIQNDHSPQQHNNVNQLFQQTETIIIKIDIFIEKVVPKCIKTFSIQQIKKRKATTDLYSLLQNLKDLQYQSILLQA